MRQKSGVTQTVITANVADDGQVRLTGTIPKGAVNPIIKVEYQNNRTPDPKVISNYAYQVVKKLKTPIILRDEPCRSFYGKYVCLILSSGTWK